MANNLHAMSTLETGANRNQHWVVPGRRRITIKTLRTMLDDLHVKCEIIGSASIDSCCTGPLVEKGGLLFVKVVDQNGTAGHCVVIDLFRKVILDPGKEVEVKLNRRNLLKCAGDMSLCMYCSSKMCF